MNNRVLEVRNLNKAFVEKRNFFGKVKSVKKAVDNISFDLYEGETLAIVGESGCGKSTLARTIMGLHKKDSGKIVLDGTDLDELSFSELKKKSNFIQMVFQDPYSSLDPSMKVGDMLSEAMIYHGFVKKEEAIYECIQLLELCGLDESILEGYASEFSGGQRQRIALARALSLNPKIIIADEAVSALDVSVQAQIINLMIKLQKKIGMSYIFISHDLSIVKYIAGRVAVMYKGEIVEIGDKDAIYKNPIHPYTRLLLNSIPIAHPRDRGKRKIDINSNIENFNFDIGCKFRDRCQYSKGICEIEKPSLLKNDDGRFISCHFSNELNKKLEAGEPSKEVLIVKEEKEESITKEIEDNEKNNI
ncbi:MAG: ABC transporter ATP-binding protein [Sarcina sp.]